MIIDQIIEFLKKRNINTILDVASGRGEFIEFIRCILGDKPDITALDLNGEMLNRAQEKFVDITTVEANACDLPFTNDSFDLVCLSNSLHHFPEPEKVISEMKRVKKETGNILIREVISGGEQTSSQQSHIMIHHFCAEIDSRTGTFHNPTFSRDELTAFVKKNLGECIKIEYNYPIKDLHDERMLSRFEGAIEYYLRKAAVLPDYDILKEKAEIIKKNLKRNGFAPAVELFFLV